MTRIAGRSRKDRAVKKAQFRFERMCNREIRGHRPFDSSSEIDQSRIIFSRKTQVQGLTFNKRIERTTVSDVELHRTQPGHLDPLVAEINERRHVAKRCFA